MNVDAPLPAATEDWKVLLDNDVIRSAADETVAPETFGDLLATVTVDSPGRVVVLHAVETVDGGYLEYAEGCLVRRLTYRACGYVEPPPTGKGPWEDVQLPQVFTSVDDEEL